MLHRLKLTTSEAMLICKALNEKNFKHETDKVLSIRLKEKISMKIGADLHERRQDFEWDTRKEQW